MCFLVEYSRANKYRIDANKYQLKKSQLFMAKAPIGEIVLLYSIRQVKFSMVKLLNFGMAFLTTLCI